jgi:hypothetical protein
VPQANRKPKPLGDPEILEILTQIVRDPRSGAQARIAAIRQLRQMRDQTGEGEDAFADLAAPSDELERRRRAK